MRIIPQYRHIIRYTIVFSQVNLPHDVHLFIMKQCNNCKVLGSIYAQQLYQKISVDP